MCGIFGIVRTELGNFDKKAFNVLGINNDSRGGDSCGIFIDGLYEYGVNNRKLYANFMHDSHILKSTKKCITALGHCRKASVGAINAKTAQPVVITEDGVIRFVLLHNGTIRNYKELAQKYIPDIDIKDMTDSQVMAYIFYHKGYDVLGEYEGGAVFVIKDYRKEKESFMMFRGASKLYSNSVNMSEERPLNFVYDKRMLVFSSISTYFNALYPNMVIYEPTANALITYDEGKLRVIKSYNREDRVQSEPYTTKYVGYGKYSEDSGYYDRWYKDKKGKSSYSWEKNYINYDSSTLKFYNDYEQVHGPYEVSSYGRINLEKDSKIKKEILYFWDGNLLNNRRCYEVLEDLCNDYGLDELGLADAFPFLINYFSPLPFIDSDGKCKKAIDFYDGELYSGTLEVPFSTRLLEFKEGTLVSSKYGFSQGCDKSFETLLQNKNFKISNKQVEKMLTEGIDYIEDEDFEEIEDEK